MLEPIMMCCDHQVKNFYTDQQTTVASIMRFGENVWSLCDADLLLHCYSHNLPLLTSDIAAVS